MCCHTQYRNKKKKKNLTVFRTALSHSASMACHVMLSHGKVSAISAQPRPEIMSLIEISAMNMLASSAGKALTVQSLPVHVAAHLDLCL